MFEVTYINMNGQRKSRVVEAENVLKMRRFLKKVGCYCITANFLMDLTN